ncbi:MAG: hypothetical protein DWQ31_04700 [Planctomycetota bacterium]|nr:MAG: hypothetical protein DWQ31_04700 [Planctomycetota bacterium]REJ97110.1 MAG: hypothetical protein DWQ35_02505 [Planctomycetota bacterium]REK22494.1 MAG: hypothetical protein DWQ42_17020 [Planctomycetota bacterium]REK47136.1 MAG: hypothetical protein DWQ46_05005 [Planctomycetota bacterium]
MFVDLLPMQTNDLLINLAAIGAAICVAAYLCSKTDPKLADRMLGYARSIASATTIFLVLAAGWFLLSGVVSTDKLSARASYSVNAWGADMAAMFSE